MKNSIAYILLSAVLAFSMTACVEESIDFGGSTEIGNIEVSFLRNGENVGESLALTSAGGTMDFDVVLNDDNVRWRVASDQPWCTVVSEEHRGTGKFTLKILPNDSFESRPPATLTFSAGEYRLTPFRLTQSGNVFIFSKSYIVSGIGGTAAEITVRTLPGVEWGVAPENGWLVVNKGESVPRGDFVETPVTIASVPNEEESRMGRIAFRRSGEDVGAYVSMWQFGTELNCDEAGNVLLPADGSGTLEILAPTDIVSGVKVPEGVSVTSEDAKDGQTRYVFSFGENLSDSRSNRAVQIAMNQFISSEVIELPLIYQQYLVAHGIMSGKGLKLFAETFNAGGDISDWTDADGNVALLGDIDMNGVQPWTSIGTETRPFNLVFDGKGHSILNLTEASPLFGHCSEATVSGLNIDASCSFTKPVMSGSAAVWASVAATVENSTVVTACTNSGTVKAGFYEHESMISALAAGLVGRVQEGAVVEKSKNQGSVTLPVEFSNMDAPVLTGGVVAELSGSLEYCTNNGEVSDASSAREHGVGGIAARVEQTGAVKGCENYAAVSEASVNGNVYAGGVAGYALGDVSDSFNGGALHITSGAATVKVGGVAGWCGPCYLNANSNKGDIVSDGTSKYIFVGGLYGQVEVGGAVVELDFAGASSEGAIQVMNMVDNCALGVGGFVGGVKQDVPIKNAEFDGKIEVRLHRDGKGTRISSDAVCAVGGILGWAESMITLSGCAAKEGSEVCVTCRRGNGSDGKADAPYFENGINVGGILGYAAKACTVAGSRSAAKVEAGRSDNRTNSKSAVGGVVGCIAGFAGRESVISDCGNTSAIYSGIQNNCSPDGGTYAFTCVGGILGAFDLNAAASSTGGGLTVSGCVNSGNFTLRRGASAGIVAYARNARLSGCTSTGNSGDYPHASAGIAGKLENSKVIDCRALGTIQAHSSPQYAGGVVAIGLSTDISGSRFFGNLASSKESIDKLTYGGIVAKSDEKSSVKDCLYGGMVQVVLDGGNVTSGITVTSANVANYPVGTGIPSVSGIGLWDGALEQ